MLGDESFGKHRDAKPRQSGSNERRAVVGLETAPGSYSDHPLPLHELPAFGALHEAFMGEQLIRDFWCAELGHVTGRCDQPADNGPDTACDQIGVGQVAKTYRAVIALSHQVDVTIAVAGMDMKAWMLTR